ncbi:Rhodopsin domain-containing protein [Madurella fahalii]|uniref:Rhodopsin domain-containing protein n=1 Tax=Madurella fahalii TaxID=1157608 RepID=A0ABQ0GH81_9PEZI
MASDAEQQPLPPDESVGPTIVAVTVSLTVLIIITTSLRLYSRWALRNLGWDDYTIAITAVLAVARTTIQAVQVVRHGNGRHQVYISHGDYIYNNMLGFYTQIMLFASSCLLKVSICLLLLRIKDTRGLKILLYTVMTGLFVTNFGCIIILLAQCSPVETYWKEAGGVCWDPKIRIHAFYVTISYNLLTDLLCSLLPIVAVWKVRIPLRTKILVSGLISMGLLATAFGVVRALSLRFRTNDMSWTYALASLWSSLELFIGIIAANCALLRSIYRVFRYGKSLGSQGHPDHALPAAYLSSTTAFRGYQFEASATDIMFNHRGLSTSQSEGSGIQLQPRTQKTTEVCHVEDLKSLELRPG